MIKFLYCIFLSCNILTKIKVPNFLNFGEQTILSENVSAISFFYPFLLYYLNITQMFLSIFVMLFKYHVNKMQNIAFLISWFKWGKSALLKT